MPKIYFPLFLLALLSGCGGGGSNPTTETPDLSFAKVYIQNAAQANQSGALLSIIALASEPNSALETRYSWRVDLNDDGQFSSDEQVSTQATLIILEEYIDHQIQASVQLLSGAQGGPVSSFIIGGPGVANILFGDVRGSTTSTIVINKSDGSAVIASTSAKLNAIPAEITAQLNNVQQFVVLHDAIALLLVDGEVIYWSADQTESEMDAVREQLNGIAQLAVNNGAFAALKKDGSIVTWGDSNYGGKTDEAEPALTDIKQLTSSWGAFAAIKEDGSVVTWGTSFFGGDSSTVQSELIGVVDIVSNGYSFAALKADGTVIRWDANGKIGDEAEQALYQNVTTLYPQNNYMGLTAEGAVIYQENEQDLIGFDTIAAQLRNVIQLESTTTGNAALNADGRVITWGDRAPSQPSVNISGGDSSAVATQLVDVVKIVPSSGAFAALKKDGSVVAWGDPARGGATGTAQISLTNVIDIVATYDAFAALKEDGTVIVWGGDPYEENNSGNTSEVIDELNEIESLYATPYSFIAIKKSGELILWGMLNPEFLGDAIMAQLNGAQSGSDSDGDGIKDPEDPEDPDDDNDGVADSSDAFPLDSSESLDSDSDGIGNNSDPDDDNDGVADGSDAFPLDSSESIDSDSDGIGNNSDPDDDNDGVADSEDAFPLDSSESIDSDGDGIGNNSDPDDDNDGIVDQLDDDPLTPNHNLDLTINSVEIANAELADQIGAQLSATIEASDPTLEYNLTYQWLVDLNNDGNFDSSEQISESASLTVEQAYIGHDIELKVQLTSNGLAGPIKTATITAGLRPDILISPYSSETIIAKLQDGSAVIASNREVLNSVPGAVLAEITTAKSFVATSNAIAILLSDGRVIYWKQDLDDTESELLHSQLHEVIQLKANTGAFAALKADGTVVTWGDESYGGNGAETHDLTNVKLIESSDINFTALKNNGTVIDWGFQSNVTNEEELTVNIASLARMGFGMAGVSEEGRVFCWNSAKATEITIDGTPYENVVQLLPNHGFTALTNDGHVLYQPLNYDQIPYSEVSAELSDVIQLEATGEAIAALTADGRVLTWGNHSTTGNAGGDSSSVSEELHDIVRLYSTYSAFAALRADGRVFTWGDPNFGGSTDAVSAQLHNVNQVAAIYRTFAALTDDGTVVIWGGDPTTDNNPRNITEVAETLNDIRSLQTTGSSFIAVKKSGEIVPWGDLNATALGDELMSRLNPAF